MPWITPAQQGIIHRDIKPANLLLSPDGRLTLNDFGLARILDQPGMTVTGDFVGTPMYMSPEQVTAGRTPLDHRTDIYSLGVTLAELLTLQRPFAGERREEILAQIIHKEPRPPPEPEGARGSGDNLPESHGQGSLSAYQTAGQMAEDLRRYLNRYAILARRASPIKRVTKWVKRHPAVAGGLVGALLCAGDWRVGLPRLPGGTTAQAEQTQHEQDLLEEKRHNAPRQGHGGRPPGGF